MPGKPIVVWVKKVLNYPEAKWKIFAKSLTGVEKKIIQKQLLQEMKKNNPEGQEMKKIM